VAVVTILTPDVFVLDSPYPCREKEESHQLHQEAWERHHSRKELRSKNQNIQEGRPEEAFFSRLDSSLKKNTAFVKKLRTLTEQQRDSLSTDFGALNLSKVRAPEYGV
jgi:regulator of nonsense transcripts 2